MATRRWSILSLPLTLGTLLLAGCSSPSPAPPGSPSRPVELVPSAELTDLERKYGIGPSRVPNVTIRSDVHVVEQGPAAVRGVSRNGLMWTLDAATVGDVKQGSVLVVTSRCAGRVLSARRVGDTVEVTLGPMQLTDVIEKADISVEQPVDLDQAIAYEAPEFPGKESLVAPLQARLDGAEDVAATDVTPAFQAAPLRETVEAARLTLAATQSPGQTQVHQFKTTPVVGSSGIGVRITSDSGGVHLLGEARVKLATPRVRFDLKMDGSRILKAQVTLSGAAGLLLAFQAASPVGLSGNLNQRVDIPTDFSIPIAGLGVPFALTVRQSFLLQTAFSSKGTVNARGDYTFGGSFGVEFGGGGFKILGPTAFKADDTLVNSVSGVSLGPTGLVFAHGIKVIVGIGAFGFVTGPYVTFSSSAAVANGSALGIVTCRQATLTVMMAAGVGYVMPQPVTRAINFFLRGLNLGEIAGQGGFEAKPMQIINSTYVHPAVKACMG